MEGEAQAASRPSRRRAQFGREESELEFGRIVAFSDGVIEPENEFGEFGEQRLMEMVRDHSHLPLPELAEAILDAVRDWIGPVEQPDDVTLVLARAR